MSLSLSDLKKSSKTRLDNLITKSQANAEQGAKDARFWQPTVDKAGNGSAVIRFLPASKEDGIDALPWVKYFEHGFKGPSGKWYIEKSLTSLGQKDPVSEYNSKLWNKGTDEAKEIARSQKRKLVFVSNILVITDPGNPENNGKVFLFKYGQKIFEKIKNIMTPDEALGEEPNDPFDFWTGQNFKLKIKKVGDFRNYDDSSFANQSVLFKKDEEIEAVWNSQYSLGEFLDPKNYETYEELEKKLFDVLQIQTESVSTTAERLSMKVDAAVADASAEVEAGEDADLDEILKNL
jgi:Mn-dependent DtxR family transcriptional regulator